MQSGKQIGGSANKDKLTNATLTTKVKDAVVDRQKKSTGSDNPGYWKKPENKDQRKQTKRKKQEKRNMLRETKALPGQKTSLMLDVRRSLNSGWLNVKSRYKTTGRCDS